MSCDQKRGACAAETAVKVSFAFDGVQHGAIGGRSHFFIPAIFKTFRKKAGIRELFFLHGTERKQAGIVIPAVIHIGALLKNLG